MSKVLNLLLGQWDRIVINRIVYLPSLASYVIIRVAYVRARWLTFSLCLEQDDLSFGFASISFYFQGSDLQCLWNKKIWLHIGPPWRFFSRQPSGIRWSTQWTKKNFTCLKIRYVENTWCQRSVDRWKAEIFSFFLRSTHISLGSFGKTQFTKAVISKCATRCLKTLHQKHKQSHHSNIFRSPSESRIKSLQSNDVHDLIL